MSGNSIINEVKGCVQVITLNRPDVLNSFNSEMSSALIAALEAARDPKIRAVLVTGAGRAFCAGQDLSDVAPDVSGRVPPLGPIVKEKYNPIIELLRGLEKPVVCAVNGTAAGAGANLAFACDIVLAADNASFIQSFSKVGLIPDSGGTFFLPRLVGLGRATSLTFLGEKISAEEARSIGLIYKVVPQANLMAEASALAQKLASEPTRGFALTKKLMNESFDRTLSEQLGEEAKAQHEAGLSHDYAEGVKAFLEKRKPEYQGK